MQNSGTLAEMPLEAILEAIQKDRATGTMHLNSPSGTATLYFLFGHLFHAVDADRVGEPVVHETLDWTEGDFTFDSKAKLPAEESIKVSTAELLASRTAGLDASPPPPEAEPAAEDLHAAVDTQPIDLAPYQPEAPGVPEALPEAEAPLADAGLEADAGVDTEPAVAEAHGLKRRRTDFRPGTRPPETMELNPVPLGEALYESLTAAFVDFPKLLRSLNKDKHCGYVRLTGDEFHAVLVFSSGAVVEAIYEGLGEVSTGAKAFKRFAENIDNSEGHLDIIELSPEMVTAIFQLLTAPGLYDRLVARFVKFDALLEHLAAEGTSGAVIVRQDKKTGVVLFREGIILGSYTEASRNVEADALKVAAICKDPKTEIEVRGGPLPDSLPVLESGGSTGKTVPSGGSRGSAAKATAAAPDVEVATAPDPEPEAEPEPAAVAPDVEVATAPDPEPEAEPEPAAVAPDVEVATAPDPEPEAEPEPAAEYAGSPNGVDAAEVDWAAVLSQMAGRADAALGTRAKKVKELLNASGHNREDVESTIERISELSIMFVDPSKLAGLADEMRRIAAEVA